MNWIGVKEVINVLDDQDFIGMFLILLFPSCFLAGYIYDGVLPHGFSVFAPITTAFIFVIERGIFIRRKLSGVKKKIEDFMKKRKSEVDKKSNPTLALRSEELSLIINETRNNIENALNELWNENKIEKNIRGYFYATT